MSDRTPSRSKGASAADPKAAKAKAKQEQREAKAKRKAERGPGPFAQIKQVFQITKEQDPNITLKLIALGLGVLVVFLLLGLLLNNWITWLLIAIPFGVLAAVVPPVLGRDEPVGG